MCSSFSPSDSCVCLLRCPCPLVLCSDLLTQSLLTLFSLLTNPSPAELWAPVGGIVPPSFWQADVLGWSCRQMPYFAAPIGCEFRVPWVRSEGGEGPEDKGLLWFSREAGL